MAYWKIEGTITGYPAGVFYFFIDGTLSSGDQALGGHGVIDPGEDILFDLTTEPNGTFYPGADLTGSEQIWITFVALDASDNVLDVKVIGPYTVSVIGSEIVE